ncbi:MAG TPA: hypothetical protein VFF16_13850 [Telluria sp.]|nr:hypothetical protein [Telluria sp.]
MNYYLAGAGLLVALVGAIHSILGQRMIFREPRGRYTGILWATWHLATVLSWGVAAILFWLARQNEATIRSLAPIACAIAVSMAASAALVCIGTHGRHPGWAALLGVAILSYLALT